MFLKQSDEETWQNASLEKIFLPHQGKSPIKKNPTWKASCSACFSFWAHVLRVMGYMTGHMPNKCVSRSSKESLLCVRKHMTATRIYSVYTFYCPEIADRIFANPNYKCLHSFIVSTTEQSRTVKDCAHWNSCTLPLSPDRHPSQSLNTDSGCKW